MQPILQSHSPSVLPSFATFHQRSLPVGGGGYIANLRRLVKFDTSLRFRLSITIGLPYYIGRPIIKEIATRTNASRVIFVKFGVIVRGRACSIKNIM